MLKYYNQMLMEDMFMMNIFLLLFTRVRSILFAAKVSCIVKVTQVLQFSSCLTIIIVSYSAYELWFKQILFEIDSVRDMFTGSEKLQNISEEVLEEESETVPVLSDEPKYKAVDENKMLEILNRMNRVVMILKVDC